MNQERIKQVLEALKSGELTVAAAYESLKELPYQDVDGAAKLDHHRSMRKGAPEVVYCEGKAPDHLQKIVAAFLEKKVNMLLTRASGAVYEMVKGLDAGAEYNERARAVWRVFDPPPECGKTVLVVSAGTSDINVAEEACVTAEVMGCRAGRLYDVGVAGIHRLMYNRGEFEKAGAIVVCAGMEGALASVVGGLTSRPIIAVPTSVGYGASFHGLSALLGMLNTCAPGVVVVNIDNGFGAGYFAAMLCREFNAG